ncbi:MAG: hypothetical protein PHP23_13270 [Desulfobacterales bacterium]|nr:hypothetical protein [Desulfobacterales bacterium]MDD4072057.1 hypothetical protein [Desulfobacterales bacterium]MDD4393378.1 hypothetical protein [Desulfobacterales bacterium]
MIRSSARKPLLYSLVISAVALVMCYGCGTGSREVPLDRITSSLRDAPVWSVLLEDMKEEGNFIKKYYHRYRIVREDNVSTTEWLEVPENYYRQYEKFLGMSLVSKTDGKESASVAPPGYSFVGDARYGQWAQDSRGNSFWEFYGKYALFKSLLGGWYRPVYQRDYDDYQRSKSRGAPYFGRNNEYGTSGTVAKSAKPDFFKRRMAIQQSKQSSFSNKVSKRIGRTRTSYRSRAGGLGK